MLTHMRPTPSKILLSKFLDFSETHRGFHLGAGSAPSQGTRPA